MTNDFPQVPGGLKGGLTREPIALVSQMSRKLCGALTTSIQMGFSSGSGPRLRGRPRPAARRGGCAR